MDELLQFLSDNYEAGAALGLYIGRTAFEITAPLTLLILNFLNS
ncbi:hypothetical protein ACTWPB_18445 [Nocardia sp. IBHARD005]